MPTSKANKINQRPLVIGIDPGLRVTGFAILEVADVGLAGLKLVEAGEIKPSVRLALPDRLEAVFEGLETVLARWQPVMMVLEEVYSEALFPKTAIVMGHVRGVICLTAARAHAELLEIPPAEVKKALTGSGRASKDQMIMSITRLLRLQEYPASEHIADALALATVGALRADGLQRRSTK
jgi:crossover junction endodeoxyribonuclease RuvC